MPVPPKPSEKRQRRNRRDTGLVSIDGGKVDVPAAPESWRPSTVRRWREFWSSKLAAQVESSDHAALERLFWLYNELDAIGEAIEATGRVVEGSQGQPRPNPLFKQVEAFQGEARQLEDRFGLSPLARLRLGITFAEASRSFDELNARLASAVQESDDDLFEEPS